MDWLFPVYIAATIFGVGITAVDLFGLIGGQSDEAGGSEDDAAGDAESDFDGEAGDSGQVEGGEEAADEGEGEGDRVSVAGLDKRQRGSWVMRILSAVRNVVYFTLGFGPVGWFALARGEGTGSSLIWSIPVGIGVMVGVRLIRRLMRQELDSQLKDQDLLMEKATVSVTINKGRMGKVRVRVGGTYTDRYARSKNPEETIPIDTEVRVVDATDDCLYVEIEQ